MAQKIQILLNDVPYRTEKAYNALRLALQLGKDHAEVEVRGLKNSPLIEAAEISTMAELTSWVVDSIIQLKFTITCPACGFSKEETMPENSCQFFYECTNCKTVLKPKKDDCCVFCSYGTVKCPPIQAGEKCC